MDYKKWCTDTEVALAPHRGVDGPLPLDVLKEAIQRALIQVNTMHTPCGIAVLRDSKSVQGGRYLGFAMYKADAWEPQTGSFLPWSLPPFKESEILCVVDAAGNIHHKERP